LNTGYNGLNYNGSGVVIGIGEGEMVNNNIDFNGRLTEIGTTDTGASGSHKIKSMQNAGGAGNIDPDNRNNAWGATLLSLPSYPDYAALYSSDNLRYTNHSYGSSYPEGGYDSAARNHDLRVAVLPNHIVSYSVGNSGLESGIAPYNFPSWATVTGAMKENKNQLAVGALTEEDVIQNFSSRGPTYDGRIIPQLVVEGEGTSFASPKVIGNIAILAQVFKDKNSGAEPPSSLIRAILMNTADDLGNSGPDFIYGYGRPNLRRAYNIINNSQFITSSVDNGITNNHTITVPSNVKQVRVMIVWPDVAASVNAATAIVNDLNLSVTNPSSTSYNPWILDSNPSVTSISAPATRGVDNLNTIEQVTVDNPAAGSWTVNVNGFNIPSGPQTYYVVYEFLYDELQIAFPLENQKFTSGETYYIRWDSYGSTNAFDLSYELNNSGTWVTMENAYDSSKRFYKWIAPSVSGGINTIRFKVQRNSLTSISGINQIGSTPDGLRITKVCGDIVNLNWVPVTNATAYKLYKLGSQNMEEVTTNITFNGSSAVLSGQSTTGSEYYAVSALTGTVEGQRTIAIEKVAGDYNCNPISWIGTTSTDWFDGTNWSSTAVPTTLDDVIIPSTAPKQPNISATGAVCNTITIDSGASLTMNSDTAYSLLVSGDWINNGTFSAGIGIVDFVNTTTYQEITGTATTNFHILKVTKGSQDQILEVNSLITLNAATNPLVITSGTFKLSSASTITPYTSEPNLNSLMGFWNNGGTINGGAFGWTLNAGLLRVSGGTTNIGTTAGNSIIYLNNGKLIIDGGYLNIAARIQPSSDISTGTFIQSGGIITVFKVGSSSTTNAPFEMGVNANCTFTGGTIVIPKASSNYADYVNLATSNLITGGTLQIGDATTSSNQTIRINSIAPIYNLTVNSVNAPKAQLVSNNLIVKNNLNISGGTFDANNLNIAIKGNWTNSGLFLPTSSNVSFEGTTNQALTGITNFYDLTLNNSAGLTLANKTTINNKLSVLSGKVNLGTYSHYTNFLTLNGVDQILGSWGSTSSTATNKNDTYFAATTGVLQVIGDGPVQWTGTTDTNWFVDTNWSVGRIPTSTDDIIIPSAPSNQPNISATGAACNTITINSGASLTMNASTAYTLSVSGNWINNGIFTRGIGTVDFVNTTSDQTISGTSTTDFNILKVTKGAQDKILEVTALISLNAPTNPLVITSGTFKLSSASTITPFTSDPDLKGLMGFWNNGGTIVAGAFNWSLNAGLLRISGGTTNIGTAAGNSIIYLNNGKLIVEGGNLNVAARICPYDVDSSCTFNQSGGVITVFKVGSSVTTRAPFEIGKNANCTISGGTIVIPKKSSHTTADYINIATTNSITGGTLQIGNGTTPNQAIRINSTAPIYNLMVDYSDGVTFVNALTVNNNITLLYGIANLGTFTHTANTLTLGLTGTVAGSWGSTASAATNTSDTSFLSSSAGIINVGVTSNGTFNSWTGAEDNSWTNTNNWSPSGIPTSTSDVCINSGLNQPEITSNVTINSLIINSEAVVTVKEGGVLNSVETITNNGLLVLKSSAAGTGYLLCNSPVNNVTQQRYLTSNQRGWRLLSNPLSDISFGTLSEGEGNLFPETQITLGPKSTGTYDSDLDTWTLSLDGVNNIMASQKAYEVFIRGRANEVNGLTYSLDSPNNVTLSITGIATNTAPAEITTVAGKYYLVANPYTAPVSVANILAASSGLSNTVSYYDPTLASTDAKVKAGGYTFPSASTIVLPPMGAIFVKASSAGTINIPKSTINIADNANFAHKTTYTKNGTSNALTINISSNGVHYDKLQLRFKEIGSTGSNIDFGKLPNTILDFYSINEDNQKMAINELELKAQEIPLGINSIALQNFTFNIEENNIPEDFEVVLKDKLLNTKTILTKGTNYNFAIDKFDASQGDDRFSISIVASVSLSIEDETLDKAIVLWPNPTRDEFYILNNQNDGDTFFEIYNITGQLIHLEKVDSSAKTTIKTNEWASGVYIIKATSNENKAIKKLIIQ
jgi:hypothetical protein